MRERFRLSRCRRTWEQRSENVQQSLSTKKKYYSEERGGRGGGEGAEEGVSPAAHHSNNDRIQAGKKKNEESEQEKKEKKTGRWGTSPDPPRVGRRGAASLKKRTRGSEIWGMLAMSKGQKGRARFKAWLCFRVKKTMRGGSNAHHLTNDRKDYENGWDYSS